MHIDLGRRGDYAIRAGLALARCHGQGLMKARAVGEAMSIPQRFVTHILADLVRAGLVASTAGPRGGYQLAHPPERISVLALLEATEGEIRPRSCPLRGGPCYWEDACALHDRWWEAQEAFRSRLAETKLGDLVERDAQLRRRTV